MNRRNFVTGVAVLPFLNISEMVAKDISELTGSSHEGGNIIDNHEVMNTFCVGTFGEGSDGDKFSNAVVQSVFNIFADRDIPGESFLSDEFVAYWQNRYASLVQYGWNEVGEAYGFSGIDFGKFRILEGTSVSPIKTIYDEGTKMLYTFLFENDTRSYAATVCFPSDELLSFFDRIQKGDDWVWAIHDLIKDDEKMQYKVKDPNDFPQLWKI